MSHRARSRPGRVEREEQLSPTRIPADTPLRSFILYYQPKKNLPPRFTNRIQGSITFDREIAGVTVLHQELSDSSRLFSRRKVGRDQPKKQVNLFGSIAGDILTLSEDRRTLSVDLAAPGRSSDVIRVLVDASGPRRRIRP